MNPSSFSTLSLPEAQLTNIQKLGYQSMTPIQQEALPPALLGKDVLAQAKTGSGKTAAFAIALLATIEPTEYTPQALILCPTRELAKQVTAEVRQLARYLANIKIATLCGGEPVRKQADSLQHGAHIIVGTPGRIKDHVERETLLLSGIKTFVLDEADRMLDMGFADDIDDIADHTPRQKQSLLFSATYPDNIRSLSKRFQKDPVVVRIDSVHTEQAIEQHFFISPVKKHSEGLVTILSSYAPEAAIVFCNTKHQVRSAHQYLSAQGIDALALHGDLEQRERDQVLTQFKHVSCRVLVATDVASRGLDIDDLPLVINLELPRDPDAYIHRIGRTGRAGKEGIAVTLMPDYELKKLDKISEQLGQSFETSSLQSLNKSKTGMPKADFKSLLIMAGRKDKIRPGDILGALTRGGDLSGKDVGKIDVTDTLSYVAITRSASEQALNTLDKGKIKGRRYRAKLL